MSKLTIDETMDNWFSLHREPWRDINGASVEGDREEWAAVAGALDRGESIWFKRVAFDRQPDGAWHVGSPRNSMRFTELSAGDVAPLAEEIRRVLAETPVRPPLPDDEGAEA